MVEPDPAIGEFLATVSPEKRRRDAERLIELMGRVTGASPRLRGSIIGFGDYHYRYNSGREGDTAAVAFAPRKAATTIYLLDGVSRYPDQLARLGPHTTGTACLYIKDVDAIDSDVLEEIIATSYRTLTEDTYTSRARDGAPPVAG